MRTKIRAAFCIRLSTSENCGTGTDITTCLLLLLLHSTYSWRFPSNTIATGTWSSIDCTFELNYFACPPVDATVRWMRTVEWIYDVGDSSSNMKKSITIGIQQYKVYVTCCTSPKFMREEREYFMYIYLSPRVTWEDKFAKLYCRSIINRKTLIV